MAMVRRVLAYAALALSVTVGGVIIGATVIAPVVSPAAAKPAVVQAPIVQATTTEAPIAQSPVVQAPVNTNSGPGTFAVLWAKTTRSANSAWSATRSFSANAWAASMRFAASRRMPQLEPRIWLAIGLFCSSAVALIIGLRMRSRRIADRSKGAPGFLLPVARTATLASSGSVKMSGRADRTPRAVMALAESGAAPAEIARRTGLPLDAVAMCLSMSTMGIRQLQPPTA